jgi:NlpC/P60 family putative phage cell wall peptidase
MNEEQLREAIVLEARSWVGTPYRHCADIKGFGVDCAMLLVRVFQTVVPHIVPPDFDPRPYAPEWYLHQHEELYLLGLGKYGRRVEHAQPGDIQVYRFGRAVGHGAIVVDDNLLIHAHLSHGNVEYCEQRTYADRLDSIWSALA